MCAGYLKLLRDFIQEISQSGASGLHGYEKTTVTIN